MSAIEKIKAFVEKHPYAVAGGVFAIGAYFVLRSRGGAAAGSDPYAQQLDAQASEVQAATQYQALQLQAQAQNASTQAQANVASQQIAGQVTIAGLQAQVADNNNTLTAQTAQQIAALQATTSQQIAALQASVVNNETNAGVEQARINAAAYTTINAQNVQAETTIASAPYISADYIAQLQHDEYLASLPQNAQISALWDQVNALEAFLAPGNLIGYTNAGGKGLTGIYTGTTSNFGTSSGPSNGAFTPPVTH